MRGKLSNLTLSCNVRLAYHRYNSTRSKYRTQNPAHAVEILTWVAHVRGPLKSPMQQEGCCKCTMEREAARCVLVNKNTSVRAWKTEAGVVLTVYKTSCHTQDYSTTYVGAPSWFHRPQPKQKGPWCNVYQEILRELNFFTPRPYQRYIARYWGGIIYVGF